jgi:hypothetical protein
MRAIWSVEPPAAHGTISVMGEGRSGEHSEACDGDGGEKLAHGSSLSVL